MHRNQASLIVLYFKQSLNLCKLGLDSNYSIHVIKDFIQDSSDYSIHLIQDRVPSKWEILSRSTKSPKDTDNAR